MHRTARPKMAVVLRWRNSTLSTSMVLETSVKMEMSSLSKSEETSTFSLTEEENSRRRSQAPDEAFHISFIHFMKTCQASSIHVSLTEPGALSLKVGILTLTHGLGFQTQQALLIIGGNGAGVSQSLITRSLHAPASSASSCCFPRGEIGSGESLILLYFAFLGIQETDLSLI